MFGSFIWINDEFDKFKERDKIGKNVIYYKFCNIEIKEILSFSSRVRTRRSKKLEGRKLFKLF